MLTVWQDVGAGEVAAVKSMKMVGIPVRKNQDEQQRVVVATAVLLPPAMMQEFNA